MCVCVCSSRSSNIVQLWSRQDSIRKIAQPAASRIRRRCGEWPFSVSVARTHGPPGYTSDSNPHRSAIRRRRCKYSPSARICACGIARRPTIWCGRAVPSISSRANGSRYRRRRRSAPAADRASTKNPFAISPASRPGPKGSARWSPCPAITSSAKFVSVVSNCLLINRS